MTHLLSLCAHSAARASLLRPAARPGRPQPRPFLSAAPPAGAGARRPALVCTASTSDKEALGEKLEVPDTLPGPKNAQSPAQPQQQQAQQTQQELSVEDIQRRAAQLAAAQQAQQAQQQAVGKESLLQGILEEVRLIKWPTPKSAVLNTLLVIGIVAGTSGMLFAVNTLLAEVARAVYGS